MYQFKCKMCGGALDITNETVATCEYCGTQQTLPKLSDDRRANLYDRANHFRRNNEFDKAMGIYEQILNEDNTDAESYWSLVLCRYGIEYVEDPASRKRIPTVNRAQYTAIFDDDNYRSALKYADSAQRTIYQQEARAINEIQKGILEISQKEEPFDIFICYKETDRNGRRTPDSVLATELYHQLVREGFKVFFSRITLEDKLGVAYEPYIFAALNSAKVMVVLGTKPEYFNAVWVKNEWSRYLSLIKNGANKILIPAYRDMDPYDLPDEFSHLQAQDMAKLGFMQDLIHGIKKIAKAEEPKVAVVKETVITGAAANTAPLLKRAFMFLEDGEWDRADDFCEQVLNIDPECATAYLGKLMTELRAHTTEALKDQAEPFDDKNNYQKALRFADDDLKEKLRGYIEYINERNEIARKDAILADAKVKMTGEAISNYESAIQLFESIAGWKDADEQISICYSKIEELKVKKEAERLERERRAEIARKEAARIAKRNKKIAIIVAPIICAVIAIVIITITILNSVVIPNRKYNNAVALMDAGKFDEAIVAFELLDGYKDSAEKAKSLYYKHFLQVGDIIEFGSYEQDNNTSNGKEPIEWLVLEKNENRIFVISKQCLDEQPYNTTYCEVTWETCTLRKWLNDNFFNNAFSKEEQRQILTTVVDGTMISYGKSEGTDTKDKIFLLDWNYHSLLPNTGSDWWTIPKGDAKTYAYRFMPNKFAGYYYPTDVDEVHAVRPVMWIDLSDSN